MRSSTTPGLDLAKFRSSRAGERFADACDRINSTFKSAGRSHSGQHYKTLLRAARDSAEDMASSWKAEGRERVQIDRLAFELFIELAAEAGQIVGKETTLQCSHLLVEAQNSLAEGLTVSNLDAAPSKEERRGRRRKPEWLEWVAEVAAAAADGDIRGTMTETALLDLVAERMVERGLEELPRSTVQAAATRILERFRAEGI